MCTRGKYLFHILVAFFFWVDGQRSMALMGNWKMNVSILCYLYRSCFRSNAIRPTQCGHSRSNIGTDLVCIRTYLIFHLCRIYKWMKDRKFWWEDDCLYNGRIMELWMKWYNNKFDTIRQMYSSWYIYYMQKNRTKTKRNETKRNKNEMKWNEMKWNEMKWNEMNSTIKI